MREPERFEMEGILLSVKATLSLARQTIEDRNEAWVTATHCGHVNQLIDQNLAQLTDLMREEVRGPM